MLQFVKIESIATTKNDCCPKNLKTAACAAITDDGFTREWGEVVSLSYLEMREMFEKQLKLLSERSVNESGNELAALSEQMVNVGKLLLSITPADEKRR